MTLPNQVNPLFTAKSGAYTVGRSLRFRSSASAYLSRTPSVTGNQKTWTWSGWVKRGSLTTAGQIFGSNYSAGGFGAAFGNYGGSGVSPEVIGVTLYAVGTVTTNAVFRDPSAWYHIVLRFDSTQATQANRFILYVNGVQQTLSSALNVTLNANYNVNLSGAAHGMFGDTGGYDIDGYLAEVNFIDGQALTPSSFGAYDTNGVWQPTKYTGTYGTNGFYLPFSNTSSTSTLVADASGNGNNWTPNNISLTAGTTYDSMIDSPTVSASSSNYAVLNPLSPSVGSQLSNGNLTSTNGGLGAYSTIQLPTSGKWYAEFNPSAYWNTGAYLVYGAMAIANASGTYSGVLATTNASNGGIWQNGSFNQAFTTWATTDVIGIAVDIGGNTVQVYRNGSALGTTVTLPSGDLWFYVYSYAGGNVINANFGQRPFSYTPPSGYSALNTYNLPTPTIANGAKYMNAIAYNGNNGTPVTVTSGTFLSDLIWIKERGAARDHVLTNSIVGVGKYLSSNTTTAETTDANTLTSFTSTGFGLGSSVLVNGNDAYIAWCWQAGAGTTSTNTSGSITSTVSVNTTAGFSIVTYTGTGAVGTIGHGLGVAPSMMIVKRRSTTGNWPVYHVSVGNNQGCFLNLTNAVNSQPNFWNSTTPTSSVFTVGTDTETNQVSQTLVAYCFAAVRGYSAFGSYTGNGSANGPFIYTGFRPRFILIKGSSFVSNWNLFDTSRNQYNVEDLILRPNSSAAEFSGVGSSGGNLLIDVLSNGFKIRDVGVDINTNGATLIYAAFAENPFNYSRAR